LPHWELVVTRHAGRTSVTVRGPETKATAADCPAEGEWLAIRFKLGAFMPLLPPAAMRDRNDVTLPEASSRSFWLNGSAWEYPEFDNAEAFVARLAKRGLIATDGSVRSALCGDSPVQTLRTTQRRFLKATGVTHAAVRQIQRARQATNLLRTGAPILDVACRAGYYDQAHLCRSLKHYIGQTPGQIMRREEQLSFLYNTEPV
ncbi:MAG TPA: AraC family transcriptional regulator, partial [Lacipirellula sp.]